MSSNERYSFDLLSFMILIKVYKNKTLLFDIKNIFLQNRLKKEKDCRDYINVVYVIMPIENLGKNIIL